MNDAGRALKRWTALAVCQALILASAGPQAYAAVAETKVAPVQAFAMPLAPAFELGRTMAGSSFGSLADVVGSRAVAAPQAAPAAANAAERALAQAAIRTGAVVVQGAAAPFLSVEGSEAGPMAPESAFDDASRKLAQARLGSGAGMRRVIDSTRWLWRARTASASVGTPEAAPGAGESSPLARLGASPSQAPPPAAEPIVAKAPVSDAKASDGKGPSDNGSFFGLGKAAAWFIGALLVAQIGVEALGAAMPTLAQKAFGDFTVVAQLAIFSSITSIIGRQVASLIIAKYGLRKVYLGSTALQLLAITALCGLLATGHMTLPLMMAFYSLKGLVGGVAATAESSVPPALLGSDQAKIERFWTVEQTLLEIIGVAGPIVTGAVVASYGFLPALIAFPVAFGVSLAIMYFTLRIPAKLEAMRLADLERAQLTGAMPGVGGIFKDFLAKIVHGAKLVWNQPALRYSFLAYTTFMALNPFLYNIIGPAYALRLVADPQVATSIAGMLTGLYSLGGLLGGFIMMAEGWRLNKRVGPEPQDEAAKAKWQAEKDALLRKSMLGWMKWGTAALLMIATFAWQSPILAMSLTIPALALVPFGIAQVITVVKLKSFFQSKAPQAEMADAMSFFGSASLAVSTIGLLSLKYLFQSVTGFTPFWYIALAMIPVGIIGLLLMRKLGAATAPPPGR